MVKKKIPVSDDVRKEIDDVLMLVFTLVVGLLGGLLAKFLKIPAPFMIGSMLLVAVVSMTMGSLDTLPSMKLFAQIISGAYIGQQVTKKDIIQLPKVGPSILGLMSLFTLNMLILGSLFCLFFKMDLVTAFLSCLPGGIVDVSLMAIDMGAETDVVATMQSVRLIGILLILPVWVSFITKRFAPELRQKPSNGLSQFTGRKVSLSGSQRVKNDLLVLFVASIGGVIGLKLGIPVGALILSLIFSTVLKITHETKQMSPWIRYLAQICAGALIGSGFTPNSIWQISQLIVPIILLLTSYLLINAFFGYLMYKRGIFDIQSALFASSPAGATDISLLAGELGGDMPKIASIQISRTLYTVIIMPLLIKLITFFF